MANNFGQKENLRILLIGRTGHGKSSTGNTIVGYEAFKTSALSESQTKTCKLSKAVTIEGRRVEVVDTPGLFDTENDHRHLNVLKELIRASLITTPGFHVIALVLRPDRFTPEIQQTLDVFYNWFGDGVEKFACVILTYMDSEEKKDAYLNDCKHDKLSELLTKCKNQVACFDNVGPKEHKSSQLRIFMKLVGKMDANNNGKCFNNVTYEMMKMYACEKAKGNISKDSIKLIRSAWLSYPHLYIREIAQALGIDINEDQDSSGEKSESVIPGNIKIYDENNELIPNRTPQVEQNEKCIHSSGPARSMSLCYTDEVGGRSERPASVPVVSDTSPPVNTLNQSKQYASDRIHSSKHDSVCVDVDDTAHINSEVIYRRDPQTKSDSDNGEDQFQYYTTDRMHSSTGTTRRKRNIDMNTVRVDVDDTASRNSGVTYRSDPQRNSYRDNDNDQRSRDSDVPFYNSRTFGSDHVDITLLVDEFEEFRRNANDDPSLVTKFIKYIKAGLRMALNKIKNVECIII